MQDLADHPFSPENVAYETGAHVSPSERAWLRWCAECERLLGHDLDGNDPESFDPSKSGGDGYSIDEAYETFVAGHPAVSYVAMVTNRERYVERILP